MRARPARPAVEGEGRLTDKAIEDWSRLSLAQGERIGDPADLGDYFPYWIMLDGRCLGTLAVALRDPGWGEHVMWVASLYLFREERRQGSAARVMDLLDDVAGRLGLGGIRLETDWTWQGVLRFYLQPGGFWVANWKRSLSLVR
jgi:GNAT superfamily N-acetyltransferase